ncbi:hypothetical protein QBC45DRAFT_340552, partial [Copromyces sp. CBS 386.78]
PNTWRPKKEVFAKKAANITSTITLANNASFNLITPATITLNFTLLYNSRIFIASSSIGSIDFY